METIKLHYRCKHCMWAQFMPEDMKMRTCRGAPPQIVVLPVKGPGGQVGMGTQMMWPTVSVDHPICGAFRRSSATIFEENSNIPLDKLKAEAVV